jgi:transcriptional regulator with XRE-family HTH domain
LAELSGVSAPAIQQMEASDGVIRGDAESLLKLMRALTAAGLDVIEAGAVSAGGGRGLRLRLPPAGDTGRAATESPMLGPHTD